MGVWALHPWGNRKPLQAVQQGRVGRGRSCRPELMLSSRKLWPSQVAMRGGARQCPAGHRAGWGPTDAPAPAQGSPRPGARPASPGTAGPAPACRGAGL